ncbi:FeoA family protein [Candidatus Formimonas warabiya]|uniref:Ferrous iron transport protein A n=1 Tax=Formimonas warabiya TaxID=1761012 RepID=A0A3G1KYN2_FORW1|nr:FeoA family protein [Candidatus Formimonas warabiya]ATW27588.1 ferrous iron transport protein A [Candidatus Formimonas warabiya]
MREALIRLNQLPIGNLARVKQITINGDLRRRMLDLGLIINTPVEAIQKSPSGDPTAYYIRGAVIALRSELASNILVEAI